MDDFYIKEEEINITDVSDLEDENLDDENEGDQKEQDGTDFLIHADEEWHATLFT